MDLNEAKQILNKNGYLLKEDAFRNNTDMSDICAIIDAHSWSPKLVAQHLEDYYYNVYLKPKDIKSTKQKYYVKNYYKIPSKGNWWNVDTEYIVEELIKENESYADVGLSNFCFMPAMSSKDGLEYVLEDYKNLNDKIKKKLSEACKKVSDKSKYFSLTAGSDGIWFDNPYMFASIIIKTKKDLTNENKEKYMKEFNNMIDEIVIDEDLNKAEYEAVSAAIKTEKEL